MSKIAVFGWTISLAGMALWLYGYLVVGTPSFVDWRASTPWWIADFLPNAETELGMILVLVSLIPIYWPAQSRPPESRLG